MFPYRLYAFDLDGTLYRGEEPIEHTAEIVAALRAQGAQVRFVTNNSGRTREDLAGKLTRMGFEAAPEEVVSSATGTAAYCQEKGIRSAFVVGEPGLVSTLRSVGIVVVNGLANGLTVPQPAVVEVDAVIAGICRHFDYPMMDSAMQQLRRGIPFIATNRDATFPMEGGRFQPGAGSIIAALETCGGVSPFVVGKPNPFLIENILREGGYAPSEVLVVGDRMDTDIECGRRAGCDTFLVLTGVETEVPDGQAGAADLRALLG
jgi:phosphoglycolate/pyridoxal phosphate phosphatase family enzyme